MRKPLASLFILLLLSTRMYGQVNSWTKPTSGNWEEPFWSAGTLPNSTQNIFFTNAGWKALALSPTTRAYPESLSVRDLTISSPTGSFNTLMLNFLGVLTPLKALTVQVNSNATLLSLNSRMEISSNLMVDGVLQFGEFSEVVVPHLEVGHLAMGEFYMTNGILNIGTQFLLGLSNNATGIQYGGTNTSADFRMAKHTTSYRLTGGAIEAVTMGVGDSRAVAADATFVQDSGRVNVSSNLVIGAIDAHGTYLLNGGTLSAGSETVGRLSGMFSDSLGKIVQSGGTNSTAALLIGWTTSGAYYTLSNGVLRTGSTSVNPRSSFFKQYDGTHVATNGLSLQGEDASNNRIFYTLYELHGGEMMTSSLSMQKSNFEQTGGTNRVSGSVSLAQGFFGSHFTLSGGFFSCSNLSIQAGHQTGSFGQFGGTSAVTNLLEVGPGIDDCCDGYAAYSVAAGQAQARNITINPHAVVRITGGSFVSSGLLTLAGGRLEVGVPQQQLGPVSLVSSSLVSFVTSPVVLHFADSHSQVLSPGGLLVITNWNGSTNGGGTHQLIFGNNSQGWSPGQLRQTVFRNPGGFPPGDYAARILASGEVVPAARPTLGMTRGANSISLSWSGPYVLQTATNVLGPFMDVTNASNPYTIQTTGERQRYFRLRQ